MVYTCVFTVFGVLFDQGRTYCCCRENKAGRGKVLCSRSHSWERQEWAEPTVSCLARSLPGKASGSCAALWYCKAHWPRASVLSSLSLSFSAWESLSFGPLSVHWIPHPGCLPDCREWEVLFLIPLAVLKFRRNHACGCACL